MAKAVTKNQKIRHRNKVNTGLVIALCIVSACLIITSILWIKNMNNNNLMNAQIENVYERNFYDLVDNVNNTEVKLSKVLASSYDGYSRKLLGEISKNASNASNNLSNLPISLNGIDDTKKFINQVGGYSTSLCDKLDRGQTLTQAEVDTLAEIYQAMNILKDNLSKFNDEYIRKGFNILQNGNLLDGDYNKFTLKIQGIKSSSVEYPTLIYDGPFADSLFNKEIKGLPEEIVGVDYAKQVIKKVYASVSDDDIDYVSDATGRFETFDFKVDLDQSELYVQITKNGGKILTVSGFGDKRNVNLTLSEAVSKAKKIAKEQTGVDFDCVWSDIVSGDAYLNLAPVINKTIIYPDLIKVKIDLSSGEMLGYSATSFYTNHTDRNIESASYSKELADQKIPSKFNVEMSRLCIAPLDYGKETLCYEYKCVNENNT